MKGSINSSKILHDINYDNYIVQYRGDIESEISGYQDSYVIIINDKYAIVSVKKDVEINLDKTSYFRTIEYVNPPAMFTLQNISPIEASKVSAVQLGTPLNLTGKGVNVAIIDTGIDYLSEEFLDLNGKTRIDCIWDQTIISSEQSENNPVPFGTLYTRDKINDAITASKEGKSPYEIVPSKDEIGHGTNMAGIIGAAGKNPKLKGVAPECNFVVVKLIEALSYKAEFDDITVPVFNISSIFTALQFLYEYYQSNYTPLVIYLPLGSPLGNHDGNGLLEQFIDSLLTNNGIALVTGTGNERNTGGHTSGFLAEIGTVNVPAAGNIELEVAPEQKHLWIEVWCDYPNVVLVEIVSPSGESTNAIPITLNRTNTYIFSFEKTIVKVNYYIPEENTGDELIRLRFSKLQPGLWKIRLNASYVLNGRYNAWMSQKGIAANGTRFTFADPFGTVTNPANSIYPIVVAAYNQNNNTVVDYSGTTSLTAIIDRIDVAAGGVNALTVAPNNTTSVVNGTSVSAAIVAGISALIFNWGIINGIEKYMFCQTLRAYLEKGVVTRSGDVSPNPYWGYGFLNIPKLFENIT